ncbi:Cytochrome P450, partial [Metarhizium majus ARSEF 297]
MKANGTVHTRVLRTVLPSHLPALYSPLSKIIACSIDDEIGSTKSHDGNPWIPIHVFEVAKKVFTAANALVLFGPELASNNKFLETALDYVEQVYFTAEILRLIPSFTHPLVAPILMRKHGSASRMMEYIIPVVQERIRCSKDKSAAYKSGQIPKDCIQFFVDANTRGRHDDWTSTKIVQVLLGIWFAGVHQLSITGVHTLQNLCQYKEYVEVLRDELLPILDSTIKDAHKSHISTSEESAKRLDNAPLLDAFLKESSRLLPSDSISVRRKVLRDFAFRDGTRLLPGDVACVPSQAIMLQECIYPKAEKFLPRRFIECENNDALELTGTLDEQRKCSKSRFCDANLQYPIWGLGKHSWAVLRLYGPENLPRTYAY